MEALPAPLESARFIAGRSRDVSVDEEGARKVAESLFDKASEAAFGLSGWKSLHELNPRAASEEAVNWVFLVDTLNFSFWSESAEQKCLVRYKGKEYSGYWALCAAVNRALDDGIPITSASYYATVTLDQVRQVFRSDTEVPMPLLEERHRVLNESGTVLLEKFGGSFLTCVKTRTVFKSGDREEVEIRGCSIWCCALICKHLLELYEKKGQDMSDKINAVLLDYYLWDYARDHREDMKDIPFHRVRCIYY
ncbi:hypothetical protein ASZ78_008141 [Callipepla squamata]|uniref:Queuosine 5'-phosphate N-glycosylase/hydrolase n=1 Tax=Callipepla squamata TaxID=9009 RepID=A0A226N4J9_CALSU|nr:hypothetical protein ASZ78_008141 [Callipepla squamata]